MTPCAWSASEELSTMLEFMSGGIIQKKVETRHTKTRQETLTHTKEYDSFILLRMHI